jgi:hypothetical protein
MAFHISGKIGVPVSIVMLLLGVGIIVSSFGIFDVLEDVKTFIKPSVTDGDNVSVIVQEFTDEDKDGSAGWYLMIQGEYSVDNNDDNITDACEGLNITITDQQGNDMNSTSGTIYCELDNNRKLEVLDKDNIDINDGWMIVGIICDTLDNAEMNGYWETYGTAGEEGQRWIAIDPDRCTIGEKYTISSNQEMMLFDRDSQAGLEEEGFWGLICGLCCSCFALTLGVGSVISGFAKNPGTLQFTTLELEGASPAPVSGEGTTIPGTTPGAILGAGPSAQPVAVPLVEGAAGKVTDSGEPEKE